MKKILITGACGQIGSELTLSMREKYGSENVVASDIADPSDKISQTGPFEYIDCTDGNRLMNVVKKYQINTLCNLVTLLSAESEANPQKAWRVNMNSLYNVLEVAREKECDVFAASSPACFGPDTPKTAPQDTLQRPTSIYGVIKVAGELLCDYYWRKYGIDIRGVRFSGVISHETIPEGGITDYAVEMFYEVLKNKKYTCFLKKGTYLPFMYITDAIKAVIDLMEADPKKLKHRNAFNVAAVSFAPEELAAEIQKYIPEFAMDYDIDPVCQQIADSVPGKLDDSAAREEWGWRHEHDLASMTRIMLERISKKLNISIDLK